MVRGVVRYAGDRMDFIKLLARQSCHRGRLGGVTRLLVSYLLSQHGWRAFLAEQGIHADRSAVLRKVWLDAQTFDPPTQRAHARGLTLADLLQHPGAFGSYLVMPA